VLLSATLDDALAEERRPNMPGADDRPNWRLPLSVPVEELADHAGVQTLARVLTEGITPVHLPTEKRKGGRSKKKK